MTPVTDQARSNRASADLAAGRAGGLPGGRGSAAAVTVEGGRPAGRANFGECRNLAGRRGDTARRGPTTGPGSGAGGRASRGEETLSPQHQLGRAREQGGSCPSGTALAL